MATGSGAFGVKAGFNQSGGGNYIVLASVYTAAQSIQTAGSGSGGAYVQPVLAATTAVYSGAQTSTLSSAAATYAVIKDLGKSIVSSTRVFRKYGANGLSFADGTPVTFYLEVSRDLTTTNSNSVAGLPKIARYA